MTEPAAIPSDTRLDRQLALLDRLAEIGLEIAEAIGAQARSGEPFDAQAAAMAYARVARAVRQTVMLQSRLIADRPAPLKETDHCLTPEDHAKDRVARIVHRVIAAEHDDEDRIERLQDEAIERLQDEDIHGAVLTRPMSEMVADICQDLGLDPDWTRLARECWAVEEIASGDVGEPLAAFARPPPFAQSGTHALEADGLNGQSVGGGVPPPLRLDKAPSVTS